MNRLRTSASWSSLNDCASWPASRKIPDVGTSRQPRMCISVDLPEPDGPVIATKSFSSIRTETSRNAATSNAPVV